MQKTLENYITQIEKDIPRRSSLVQYVTEEQEKDKYAVKKNLDYTVFT